MPTQSDPIKKLQVLLIEDNPDDRDFLSHHLDRLKELSVNLECCSLLSEGLNRLAKKGIDIIFLDLSLPDSQGIDTLLAVYNLVSNVPIVVLTGTDDDALALRALKSGAQDYLVKGCVEPLSLGRSISYAIERQHNQKASQWFEAVVNASTDAIIGTTLEKSILSWNHGAERIFGYSAVEAIGKSINIIAPDDLRRDLESSAEKIAYQNLGESFEARRLRKDGTEITVRMSESPVFDDGNITGVSVIAQDITHEKLTAETLQQTTERLKRAADASKIGLWDWNLRENELRWDEGMYKLFGVTEEQFIPSLETFLDCVFLDDRQQIKQKVESTVANVGEFSFDYRAVRSDGAVRVFEAKGSVLGDQSNQPMHMTGACFDVTEERAAENALRDSDWRLRLALESANMGVYDWNLTTGSVWRTLKHDLIFGYESMLPAWTYEMFRKHVIPADLAYVEETLDKGFKVGQFKMEFRITTVPNQAIRWILSLGEAKKDEQGNVIRMVGTIADITEAKQLEQAAMDSRKRREQISRAIVQHAPLGIVILDSEFNVAEANDVFISMMHCGRGELLNRPINQVLPAEVLRVSTEFVETGKQLRASRMQVSIDNGKAILKRYWDLSFWPVADEQGCLISAITQITDCTDNVLLEQQREDFVAAIAHDIKNPLIGTDRILDILCDKSMDPSLERNAQMLSVLRESNTNLLSLVQNLVDVHRYETLDYPLHYEDANLDEIISSCIKQVAVFSEHQNVTVHGPIPGALLLRADAAGIRRVLTNLLHNAVKFSDPGSAVSVDLVQVDDGLQISVTDSGVGINETDQQILFQRFAQGVDGKRYTSGTGLGLYLSRQIIEAHNGTITCKSKPGFGSTFAITLPFSS